MTNNAIQYMANKESARHNRATEREQKRANLALENWRAGTLAESQRTNLANEAIRSQTNVINSQHYQTSDAENMRHNQAVEWETNRNNVINNQIGWENARSNLINAQANQARVLVDQTNAETNRLNYEESFRSHKANEILTSTQLGIQQQNVTNQGNRWAAQTAQDWAMLGPQSSQIMSTSQLNTERSESERLNRTLGIFNTAGSALTNLSKEARGWVQILTPSMKISK